MCHELGKTKGAMVGGNVMVMVGFFSMDMRCGMFILGRITGRSIF